MGENINPCYPKRLGIILIRGYSKGEAGKNIRSHKGKACDCIYY